MLTDNFVLFSFLFSLYCIYIWKSTPRSKQKDINHICLASFSFVLLLSLIELVFSLLHWEEIASHQSLLPTVSGSMSKAYQHTVVVVHVSWYHPEWLTGVKDEQILLLQILDITFVIPGSVVAWTSQHQEHLAHGPAIWRLIYQRCIS